MDGWPSFSKHAVRQQVFVGSKQCHSRTRMCRLETINGALSEFSFFDVRSCKQRRRQACGPLSAVIGRRTHSSCGVISYSSLINPAAIWLLQALFHGVRPVSHSPLTPSSLPHLHVIAIIMMYSTPHGLSLPSHPSVPPRPTDCQAWTHPCQHDVHVDDVSNPP